MLYAKQLLAKQLSFMPTIRFFLIAVLVGCFSYAFSQSVNIVYQQVSPQGRYAAERLKETLVSKGYTVSTAKATIVITLSTDAKPLHEEAYSIHANCKSITVTGGDNRGMIYGALSLAEEVRNGRRLEV